MSGGDYPVAGIRSFRKSASSRGTPTSAPNSPRDESGRGRHPVATDPRRVGVEIAGDSYGHAGATGQVQRHGQAFLQPCSGTQKPLIKERGRILAPRRPGLHASDFAPCVGLLKFAGLLGGGVRVNA